MDLFKTAARKKYRFDSIKGQLDAEQLWDLPLTSKTGFDLDTIAKGINRELKAQTEDSFVTPVNSARSTELENKLAIAVHVIETKQAENEATRNAATKLTERTRLVEILEIRNQEELLKLSPTEIQARIDALSAAA